MKAIILLICSCFLATAIQAQDTIYVPGASNLTIQQGIDSATTGDIVLVSDETYSEQINFHGKAITVASWFLRDGDTNHINNTIIDGANIQYPDPDSCSLVYFINNEDTTSVLCGFTIQNGKGTFGNWNSETHRGGGGIFIKSAGAKIIHNHITDHHLDDGLPGNPMYISGAGIAILGGTDKWVVIDHNVIDQNSCSSSQAITAEDAGICINSNNCRITYNNVSWNTCTAGGSSLAYCSGFLAYSSSMDIYTTIVHSNVFYHNLSQITSGGTGWSAASCGAFQNVTAIFYNNMIIGNEDHMDNFSYNAPGGIIGCINPSPGSFFRNNSFQENTTSSIGGGLYIGLFESDSHDTVLIENNYFSGNEAYYGGGVYIRSVPVLLQNNVFSGNQAFSLGGAAIFTRNQTSNNPHLATLINNTFANNHAGQRGGAISTSQVNPLIINSIFWNDSAVGGSEIYINIYDTAEIAFSDIDPAKIEGPGMLVNGDGNINGADPLFDDPDLLTISPESPCLDAGIDVFTCACGVTNYSPTFDIMGNGRPHSGGFEMGAYELLFTDIPAQEDSRFEALIYPNPSYGNATINYTLEQGSFVMLEIFDCYGKLLATFVNGWQSIGEHKVAFNAENLPSGLYFYRIQAGNKTVSGKMVVMK